MSVDLDERTYIRELEDNLQLILFGDGGNATAVVLLVRSALSAGVSVVDVHNDGQMTVRRS
jgi:hypothetical protein